MKQRIPLIPAVYIVIRRDDEVLLSRRLNTGWRDGQLSLVAGHVEDKEYPIAAAVREVQEEVGLKTQPTDFRFVHVVHRIADEQDHERLDFFFELANWEGEIKNCEPEKCSELVWAPLISLPDDVVPVVARVLSRYQEPSFYSELIHD